MLQYYKYVKSYDNTLYQRLHTIYIKQEAKKKGATYTHIRKGLENVCSMFS